MEGSHNFAITSGQLGPAPQMQIPMRSRFACKTASLLLDGVPEAQKSVMLERKYLEVLEIKDHHDKQIEGHDGYLNARDYFKRSPTQVARLVSLPNSPLRRILSFSPNIPIEKLDYDHPTFLQENLRPLAPLHRARPLNFSIVSVDSSNLMPGYARHRYLLSVQRVASSSMVVPFVNDAYGEWLSFKDIPPSAILSSNISSRFDSESKGHATMRMITTTVGIEAFIAICETSQMAIDVFYPLQDKETRSFDIITTMKSKECEALLSNISTSSQDQPFPIAFLARIIQQELEQHRSLIRNLDDHVHWLGLHVSEGSCKKFLVDSLLATAKLLENLQKIQRNYISLIDRVNPPKKNKNGTGEVHNNPYDWQAIFEFGFHTIGNEEQEEFRLYRTFFKQSLSTGEHLTQEIRRTIDTAFELHQIRESRRSMEQNTSLKRLSWITFIFLPLLFIAALFGMNVDILGNNPQWWWYLVWSVPATLIIFGVWYFIRWRNKTIATDEESLFQSW